MYEGDGTEDLIDEMCDTIIAFCIEFINQNMNVDEGEKTRLLIDISELLMHKLIMVYPSVQPLDSPVEIINSIINELEERRTMLMRMPSGIVN